MLPRARKRVQIRSEAVVLYVSSGCPVSALRRRIYGASKRTDGLLQLDTAKVVNLAAQTRRMCAQAVVVCLDHFDTLLSNGKGVQVPPLSFCECRKAIGRR